MIVIPDYKQLQQLKDQYNNINTLRLKANIKSIVKLHKISYDQIAALSDKITRIQNTCTIKSK